MTVFTYFGRAPLVQAALWTVLFGWLWGMLAAGVRFSSGRLGSACVHMFQKWDSREGGESPARCGEARRERKRRSSERRREEAGQEKNRVRDHTGGYQRSPIINKVLLPYRGSGEDPQRR